MMVMERPEPERRMSEPRANPNSSQPSSEGALFVSATESGLMDALGEAACLSDAQGGVLWSNELFRQFGPEIHAKILEIMRSAAVQFAQLWGDHDGANPWKRRSYRVGSADGQRFFKVRVAPIAGNGGGLRVAAVVLEVTRQRLTKKKIAAIIRAGRELVHIETKEVRERHVADRLKVLEDKVIRFSHELLNFDHFAVRLLNPETNKLDLAMSKGLPPEATAIELHASKDGNGISGFVAATGESYICRDATKDRRYVFGMEHAGSSLTVPLRLFDRTIGVFNVESDKLNAFGKRDQEFAEIFANYLAMALHILNLLVVERFTTSETATDTVQGEINEPLNDLAVEAEWLKERAALDPEATRHVEQIVKDVESIRKRMARVSKGQPSLLGVEEAMEKGRTDPALKGSRILVADDDEVVVQTIRDVLTSRGCEVVVLNSAQAAIDRLDAAASRGERFDLVLSDINLGDRTGYEVFASAKKLNPDLPVILMTGFGYDPHHSIVRASQEGLQCVLFKPFQAEKLVDEARIAVVKLKMTKAGVR